MGKIPDIRLLKVSFCGEGLLGADYRHVCPLDLSSAGTYTGYYSCGLDKGVRH
jgi:hypothetical protein